MEFCADWRHAKRETLEAFHRKLLWCSHRQGGLYSPNTVDQALRTVRAFCRWVHRVGLVPRDPTQGWLLPRPSQPEQRVLSRDQVLALLNSPDVSKPNGQRDQLVLELLYHLQLSVGNCLELRLENLESDSICAAGNRWPLEPVRSSLERYLNEGRPQQDKLGDSTLLLNRYGRPLTTLKPYIQFYGQRLGLSFPISPRTLHRSYKEHQRELHDRRFRR